MSGLNNLLLHPKTRRQTDLFLQRPISPLLILGERGSGKLELAYSVTCAVLDLGSKERLLAHAYFFHAAKPEDKQDIPIDTVRQMMRFLRLKTPGSSTVRRVVLIEDAHFLSHPAQNALLKTLEEPNDDTLFVLTALNELSLLPTIVSRCQRILTYPVALQQADKFYGSQYGHKKVETAWNLSQGSTSLLNALLHKEGSHSLKVAIEEAKSFLRLTPYERLLALEKTNKNKEELRLTLEALSKILAALHRNAVSQTKTKQARKLVNDRKLILDSIDALDNNANSRLLCLNLVLKLKS
ncbi:MAG TPA: hypothetical protein VIK37_00490 [Candidatus Saccharimonadales bacterium]